MKMIFRARSDLLSAVRGDLHRLHAFAAERVGWLVCRAGRLADGGLVILASGYDAVADEDYVNDPSVGARIGPAAIRKALQRAYNGVLRISVSFTCICTRIGVVLASAMLMTVRAGNRFRIFSTWRRQCRTARSF